MPASAAKARTAVLLAASACAEILTVSSSRSCACANCSLALATAFAAASCLALASRHAASARLWASPAEMAGLAAGGACCASAAWRASLSAGSCATWIACCKIAAESCEDTPLDGDGGIPSQSSVCSFPLPLPAFSCSGCEARE
eukprot:3106444-Pyramimonas_sp.AAC.1